MWIIALGLRFIATRLTAESCSQHTTMSHCIAFRRTHACIWDASALQCVDDVACEHREQKSCEFELTNGKSAPWDSTKNKCFWDSASEKCRWTDECLSVSSRSGCKKSGCSYQKRCAPVDLNRGGYRPNGKQKCARVCVPPGNYRGKAGEEVLDDDDDDISNNGNISTQLPFRANSTLQNTPVINLPAGSVRGVRTADLDTFYGLPFAAAPVADLRWSPPSHLASWGTTVFDATSAGASCVASLSYTANDASQSSCGGLTREVCAGYSEDCLSLTVYSPRGYSGKQRANAQGLRPVMVWIHGGCFVMGSSNGYDGSDLAVREGVVVVVVNYRIGVMGFLGHDGLRGRDPDRSTGNYGLLDNVAALQWINTNIASLGGDPSRVTIFGESSGAGSVSQLLGVPKAWPYFHRAIMESGAGSFWTYYDMLGAYHAFAAVTDATGCSSKSSIDQQVDCLTQADSGTLSSAVSSVFCRDGCSWAPVVDGVVVRGRTTHLARTGRLRPNTPIIVGHNLNDGASFVPYGWDMSPSDRTEYFTKRFGPMFVSQLEAAYPEPSHGQTPYTSTSFMSVQACETDWSYACTNEFLASASTDANTFFYQFSQVSPSNGMALHGYDVHFVFGTGTFTDPGDIYVRDSMQAYWANFAATGDPNDGALPAWPDYNVARQVQNISAADMHPFSLSASSCDFFTNNWDYLKVCLPENPYIPI